ncbi:hypothetical protein ACFSCV_07030 [Methylopila henanensis]|uniref:Uncharacterized protein n=1 Tax=Methylopila henanensis TaxID=873516 RepID=A0ABW4K4X6_9HYPH
MTEVEGLRSAALLTSAFAEKMTVDDGFRQRVAADPKAAVDELKKLESQAIGQVDATGSGVAARAKAAAEGQAASADKLVYVIAVACLGFVSVAVVFAIFGVAWSQLPKAGAAGASQLNFAIPDGLVALGSAAIGALAGLLGPLSQRRG